MLESLQSPGEPEDPPEVPHRGEALHVRIPGLHQGLQQRQRQGQAPEQDTLQRGEHTRVVPSLHLGLACCCELGLVPVIVTGCWSPLLSADK